MKNSLVAFAALAALSSTSAGALAHAVPSAAKKMALICPVTGTKISSAKAAAGHSIYKGKTYYFCCPECKPRFDKSPAKTAANAAKGKYEKM